MRLLRRTFSLLAAAALLGGGGAFATPEPEPDALGAPIDIGAVLGKVTASSTPLAQVSVYAYQIADLTMQKVVTDDKGAFSFSRLPAGLYKIIAYKSGFVPTIAMLSRATADARQDLELELMADTGEAKPEEGGFWALRQRIPGDVLRDIEHGWEQELAFRNGLFIARPDHFSAEMQANTGTREGIDYGSAQVSSGRVGFDGRYGDLKIGVDGHYTELEGETKLNDASGRTQKLRFQIENNSSSHFDISSRTNQLVFGGQGAPVDFESHSISWRQQIGDHSHSSLTAQYTAETNFHSQYGLQPREIPDASRALRLEGSYTTPLTDNSTIQAGFRYRELETEYFDPGIARLHELALLPSETVEIYGRGGVEVKPTVVVEYGLYSKLRDGGLSLAPQGGLVLQLNDRWQASTLVSHRIDQAEVPLLQDFSPVFHGEGRACEMGEEYCYQMLFSRLEGDHSVELGATHRQFGETIRLYFNRDFYNRLESLFMVPGDEVPELQLGLTRRLTPRVLTRLEGNLASGGGGIVRTGRGMRTAYENKLSYLVTSLDTQFETTATGVFVAFHRLEQELSPVQNRRLPDTLAQVDLERLQFMLTQDLGFLRDLAWDLAVHVNMEVSRGSTDGTESLDELRKRLTGGIAVKF